MKNIFTFFSVFIFLQTVAQEYQPIPESDAVWIQASFLYSMNDHEHTTITNPLSFGEDTLISGESYHTLQGHQIVEWVDGWGDPQNYQTGTYTVQNYKFRFRQDAPSKKVYAWAEGRDTLLYDFDLTVGQIYPQTLLNVNYPNLKVMGEDSVQLLDGVYHKKWLLGTDSADSGYISLIEGVGATSGFSLMMYPLFEQSGAILCLKESDVQLYENWSNIGLIAPEYSELCEANVSIDKITLNETTIHIWPNPMIDQIHIRSDDGINSIDLIDIYGKSLQSIEGKNVKELNMNLEYLDSGQYFLKVTTSNQQEFVKTIIK